MEKRHDARVHARGSVFVHTHRGERGRIIDLSAGGVRLALARRNLIHCIGGRVAIELRLDGAREGWVHLNGQIRRVAADGTVSVAFFQLPTDFEDLIQDQLVSELECTLLPHALVVDPATERRQTTARQLRADGWYVTESSSPLEAIDHLGESSSHPSMVIVAPTSPSSIGHDLRRYLAREHASIRVKFRNDPTA